MYKTNFRGNFGRCTICPRFIRIGFVLWFDYFVYLHSAQWYIDILSWPKFLMHFSLKINYTELNRTHHDVVYPHTFLSKWIIESFGSLEIDSLRCYSNKIAGIRIALIKNLFYWCFAQNQTNNNVSIPRILWKKWYNRNVLKDLILDSYIGYVIHYVLLTN